jgi:hypothetical protein
LDGYFSWPQLLGKRAKIAITFALQRSLFGAYLP